MREVTLPLNETEGIFRLNNPETLTRMMLGRYGRENAHKNVKKQRRSECAAIIPQLGCMALHFLFTLSHPLIFLSNVFLHP